TFFAQTFSTRGGCARRPPTVPGACAPVMEPRIRGTRETPWPFPDQRTECFAPDLRPGPYGCRRFAWAAVTARRIRSERTSPRNTVGRSTDFTTSPSREYTCTRPPSRERTSAFASFAFAAFGAFGPFGPFSGSADFLRRTRAVLRDSAGASEADFFFDSGMSVTLPVSIPARRR